MQQPRLDESAVRDPIIVPRFIKSDVTSEFQARFSLHVTHVSRDIDAHLHVNSLSSQTETWTSCVVELVRLCLCVVEHAPIVIFVYTGQYIQVNSALSRRPWGGARYLLQVTVCRCVASSITLLRSRNTQHNHKKRSWRDTYSSFKHQSAKHASQKIQVRQAQGEMPRRAAFLLSGEAEGVSKHESYGCTARRHV